MLVSIPITMEKSLVGCVAYISDLEGRSFTLHRVKLSGIVDIQRLPLGL